VRIQVLDRQDRPLGVYRILRPWHHSPQMLDAATLARATTF
jgi:hypothetical protein